MRIDNLDYDLPEELIAQEPLSERTASRMLTIDRKTASFSDGAFIDLPKHLKKGDTLVLNNTKVFPARLLGQTETGAQIEVFLIREREKGIWESLGRPACRMQPGKKLLFGQELTGSVIENADGRVIIDFEAKDELDNIIDRVGRTPLPHYIKRDVSKIDADRERYQTVFSSKKGAVAAPTAGLHFSPAILDEIETLGANICEITLHVGYGTFEPIRSDDLAQHRVLPEDYEVSAEASEILNQAVADARRIVAVGTTTTRTLETIMTTHGRFSRQIGTADLTITPGYRFKVVDALLTNFHLPKSSLLLLVSTFAGLDLTMKAYHHAVESRYRFFSYGDCMFIE